MQLGNTFLRQTSASNPETARQALVILVNMSSFTAFRSHMYSCDGVCDIMLDLLRDQKCTFRDLVCLFLNNYTQCLEGQPQLCQVGAGRLEGLHLKRCILFFAKAPRSEEYSRLNEVLCNVTQCPIGRKLVLKDVDVLVKIMPWADPKILIGVLGCLRNICFDADSHEKLMSEELELVVQLGIFL